MSEKTRDQLIVAGRKLFAEKGFYGASIAKIAAELGVTKQTLLHHFGSKEKLYAEVLQHINDSLVDHMNNVELQHRDPITRLEQVFLELFENQKTNSEGTRIVMRELLDNVARVDRVKNWYLKEFLNSLITLARQVPNTKLRSDGEILAAICQLLGAVNYFNLSQQTLQGILGIKVLKQANAAFPKELKRLVRSAFSPTL